MAKLRKNTDRVDVDSVKPDGAVVARARGFARQAHGRQTRKYSGEPYIQHLDSVVRILRSFGIDSPRVLCAAYLHDTVEDTSTTIEHIFDVFGEDIAELVYWLTDAEQGNRHMRKIMSAWRLGRAPFEAKLIKLADLIDNTENICRNDPPFALVYLREKTKILEMMLRTEGRRLADLPIFAEASGIMHLERSRTMESA